MIGVINYGMGNLRSVVNAFTAVGAPVEIVHAPEDLRRTTHIVLPGVGSFGDGMSNLRSAGWVEALDEEVRRRGKPFLGICLGMQLLAGLGTEHGRFEGLGWIAGSALRLSTGEPPLRLPHIGWNDVRFVGRSRLYRGLGTTQAFYFVHSYALYPDDAAVVSGVCDYGTDFAASVEIGNIFATQFHPEKSHKAGLAVLRNFAELTSPTHA